MSSAQAKVLIIECWFRKLLSCSFSIDDIAKIVLEYAKEFELFDKDLIHSDLKVDDEYRTISNSKMSFGKNAFGTNIAVTGYKYHWKVKIEKDISGHSPYINIGIIEADRACEWLSGGWWRKTFGYSYFKSGTIWNGKLPLGSVGSRRYGQEHYADDIIDMWLDLKDNNDLSFGKNGKNYGHAFDIPLDKEYRFALNVKDGKVTIECFEFDYSGLL